MCNIDSEDKKDIFYIWDEGYFDIESDDDNNSDIKDIINNSNNDSNFIKN